MPLPAYDLQPSLDLLISEALANGQYMLTVRNATINQVQDAVDKHRGVQCYIQHGGGAIVVERRRARA